jgi:hypothetical protein
VTINAWFQLVEEPHLSYGILTEDTYNFDETGFMVAIIATSKVVTSSDTVGQAIVVQPGNCEWITAIEGIDVSGWVIPLFIILPGKVHQSNWYCQLLADWVITVSDNGWTIDQLGTSIIPDDHNSHETPEFAKYCRTNNIITLRMLPHTSHLLQPLDVSCFSLLKCSYGQAVQELVCQGTHIDKKDFLSIYTNMRPDHLL